MLVVNSGVYAPLLGLRERLGFRLVEYIHFPIHDLLEAARRRGNALRQYLEEQLAYIERYTRGFGKVYYSLWRRLYRRLARHNPFDSADLVLVNSRYTARIVKLLWGGEPIVLHPPVDTRLFMRLGGRGFEERENSIITVGRISPEKRIEVIIEAVARTRSKPVIRLAGALTPGSRSYLARLERLAERLGVTMEVYTDISRSRLAELLASSRVAVHATIGEHFGIAVVEAMAAGCPVVVHRSGGPYYDIIGEGRFGLSFRSVDELAGAIDALLLDPGVWREYHQLSLERAKAYDVSVFGERVLEVFQRLC